MDRSQGTIFNNSNDRAKIFWHNIICRFGVQKEITVDNGKQFDCDTVRYFCLNMGTKVRYASVYDPQSNDTVERANGIIFSTIRKMLFDHKKGKWIEELPIAVWSHNTTESRATKFTTFRLLYGTEAMMPEEIRAATLRVTEADDASNKEKIEKDMFEIDKLNACQDLEAYQRQTRNWRDPKANIKDIRVGDLVLKRKQNVDNLGRLVEKWEGPSIAVKSTRAGAFYLATEDGKELPHSWNMESLLKYYN